MKPYIVKQGDYLRKIAMIHGFIEEEVWDHEKNKRLRSLRDPNQLYPGDILFIPEISSNRFTLQAGELNACKVKIKRATLSVIFHDQNGPLKHEPFVLEAPVEAEQKMTDAEGKATFHPPLSMDSFDVIFTQKYTRYLVRVGWMNPIEEDSGIRRRLIHLGYLADLEAAKDLDLRPAILQFQKDHKLAQTGAVDDETARKLKENNGS